MSFNPDPSPGAFDPVTRNPMRAFARNSNIVTGHPNIASAIPAPVSRIPVVTGSGWSRIFNDHLWRRDANIDIGQEASWRPKNQSETGSQCRSSPSAGES